VSAAGVTDGPRRTARRRLLAGLAASASAAAFAPLAGCGFELRRPPRLSLTRLHLAGFDARSPMAGELRRQLLASPGLRLLDSPAQAQAVLVALEDARDQSVAGSTAAGQVRELTLRSRLRYRVDTADGRALLPETTLALSQPMSYDETAALAKEQEAAMLFRAMERDIATQVLRRMAALPAAGPAASAPG
jgi:LPS-assembly lipoprotein